MFHWNLGGFPRSFIGSCFPAAAPNQSEISHSLLHPITKPPGLNPTIFKHFKFTQLSEVPDKSEFRYKNRWYEKITPNVAQESARNKHNLWNFLYINCLNGENMVALLKKAPTLKPRVVNDRAKSGAGKS